MNTMYLKMLIKIIMKITLNNKKVNIKTSENMTVSEYIKYNEIIEQEVKKIQRKGQKFISYAKIVLIYLSCTTKFKFSKLLENNIDEKTIHRIYTYIRPVIPLKEIPQQSEFYYKGTGRKLYANSVN